MGKSITRAISSLKIQHFFPRLERGTLFPRIDMKEFFVRFEHPPYFD